MKSEYATHQFNKKIDYEVNPNFMHKNHKIKEQIHDNLIL